MIPETAACFTPQQIAFQFGAGPIPIKNFGGSGGDGGDGGSVGPEGSPGQGGSGGGRADRGTIEGIAPANYTPVPPEEGEWVNGADGADGVVLTPP